MGHRYYFYILPVSQLEVFRQFCLTYTGHEAQQGLSQQSSKAFDELSNFLEENKLFHVQSPKSWYDLPNSTQTFGDQGMLYYTVSRDQVTQKINQNQPEWFQSGMDIEIGDSEYLFYDDEDQMKIYKKIYQVMKDATQQTFLVLEWG